MNKVLLYSDSGVDRHLNKLIASEFTKRNYDVEETSSEKLANEPWEEMATLLIMPGGRDIPYHQKLQGIANKRIKAYVTNGGRYLGICAGAYYGSSHVEFDKGGSLEVCQDRELAFFPKIAVGPAYGVGTFHYRTESGCNAVPIDYATTNLTTKAHLFYNGGCYFSGAEKVPGVRILGRYADLSLDNNAAIILCQVGKGKALLSAVHIEQGVHGLKFDNPYHIRIAAKLKESEKYRQLIFDDLLNELYR